MLHFDLALFWVINGLHCPAFDLIFFIVTQGGNGWVIVPLLATALIWKYRQKSIRPILVCAAALTLSGLVNNVIKSVVDRPRPAAFFNVGSALPEAREYQVHVVGEPLFSRSFPSGHTNTAFAAATLFVIYFGRRRWWVFLLAGLVGYSRIYLGHHFPADVCAGALLGVIVSWMVVTASRMRRSNRPKTGPEKMNMQTVEQQC